ncbi:DNA adenine methylase [Saccharothrix sp. ALI-22-I]|uniref:DNA adenine methylase n=1 Tax=Saccharothrix sp. ALI-22-I TaxID=1933778 RepID=UPI00097C9EDD|nr:Dam family site-specific DNA-(adenine-N6)-methyltransferase [Saccharothrix sp. ALI-22-I]ONI83841.1 DNA adenine methylase [Saccharothrix sp. ALI-22-I]
MTTSLQSASSAGGDGRSFLKWAGGKTRYVDQLVAIAPPYRGRYFEPFMGSAAVFFAHRPAEAFLSDSNQELVVCFQVVARDPAVVMQHLDRMPNSRDFFEEVKSLEPEELTAAERAARVIYLNKTSFRGLWRVNKKGRFNAPYGAYDRPYYNRNVLLAAAKALAFAEISTNDFEVQLQRAKPGDWVFLDPPYIPVGGFSDFKRYTAEQFGCADHERLAAAMRDASSRGVFLTLTNSNTDETKNTFAEFDVFEMPTRRDINLQSTKRVSSDLVFTNYKINSPGPTSPTTPPNRS